MRIALITRDISPVRGSEASVSWNFVREMSRHVHIDVFYAYYPIEIKQYEAEHGPLPNVVWHPIPIESCDHIAPGLKLDYYYSLYYRRWHKRVYEAILKEVEAGNIDLIHYLNPIGFKEPGFCWKIKDVPYVWGPVTAVENRPFSLYRTYLFRAKVSAFARRIVHNALFRYMPRVRKAFRRADAIFATTPNTVRLLKKHHGKEAIYLPENGVTAMERTTPISLLPDQDMQLIWVGRVNDENKAIGILINALTKVKSNRWHLHVVGPGELRPDLAHKTIAFAEHITFHGKLSRSEVLNLYSSAHLHIISSMGESNPTTIWEASSHAVPTITLDHCGMSGVVCDRCGIKIPIESYDKVTSRIAAEIDRLIAEPERVEHLSAGVIKCADRFLWRRRIPLFLDTYRRLIQR